VISDFHRQVDENWAPPGYYPASSGNFLPKFRDDLWKMGPTGHPKTLVRNYHYLQCSNLEECRSYHHSKFYIASNKDMYMLRNYIAVKLLSLILMEEENRYKILHESQINTLIPCSRILQNLTVTHLMHKFTTFYVNQMFATIFIKAWISPYPQPCETNPHYDIWCSHSGVDEDSTLIAYDAMWTGT
jgi:hypothetical protein